MGSSSTKYSRIRFSYNLSRVATYADPIISPVHEMTFSHNSVMSDYEILATTGGDEIDLGLFSSIDTIIVQNRDATNFVDAVVTNTPGGASNTVSIYPGRTAVLGSSITPSGELNLTASTASCECVVTILGES